MGRRSVRVAYVIIDVAIGMPFARHRRGDTPDDFLAKPDDLAWGDLSRCAPAEIELAVLGRAQTLWRDMVDHRGNYDG